MYVYPFNANSVTNRHIFT